jgi:phosphatidylethanolamine/phosphatidyl-N-methylethanolamine N-methyltransferase
MAHTAGLKLKQAFTARFDDELRFFKGWIDRPKTVGSIIPTSSVAARRMACVVNPASGLPVLEIGPGTGVVTRAILGRGVKPENLYAVEYAPEFVRHLNRLYPRVNVIEGDAFDLDTTLGKHRDLTFDCVVSAIPLLNFPVAGRVRFVEDVLSRIPAGRPMIQITYGPRPPVPAGKGNYQVRHFDFVFRNIPPSQLWVYHRPT